MVTIIVLWILTSASVVALWGMLSLRRDLDNEATRRERARAASSE